MKVALRSRITKKWACVAPTPVPGAVGDARFPVKFDRDWVKEWETFDLIPGDGNVFFVDCPASKRTLCLAPDGWQTRPLGTRGPWEALRAMQEPVENGDRMFIYRYHYDALVDVVELFEVRPDGSVV